MNKNGIMENSYSEKPLGYRPRRLVEWINLTGAKKIHSLVDKVYKGKNLEMAWKKVKANKGVGGIDGQSLKDFEENLEENLKKLQTDLVTKIYHSTPVNQQLIPKAGQPEQFHPLGIPTIFDRVCQQALLNRLEPIFDDASFGYRKGRSTKNCED